MSLSVEHQIDIAETAAAFINATSRHVFLTGKAGTGKTTFLHATAKATHKRFIIVAPTGIAALNAGGVTIHSQFLLPTSSFLPEQGATTTGELGNFYDARTLMVKNPLNAVRAQVLREIELLIIDEVSMLRCDVLDAIDTRLRAARRRPRQAFGGVQLLLIGDLLQLPPIMRDQEWSVLKKFYNSPHFFEARGLKEVGYVYLELDKVYRQTDDRFVGLLNNLRHNQCTQGDIDLLNSHFEPNAAAEKGVITLTTHNAQADRINQQQLRDLPGKSYTYEAEIDGEFPESMYPLPTAMELKVGAQVMFIKNDTIQKRYYNGKLAEVTKLSSSSIDVRLIDDNKILRLEEAEWRNVKYHMDKDKHLSEEIAGVFRTFPIKLAWAITVHKSQGLTFDKALIDVGQAFAPGQVYVALSRLRSLDGLRLRTKIHNQAILTDQQVIAFQSRKTEQAPLPDLLRTAQGAYLGEVLEATFNLREIEYTIQNIREKAGAKMIFEEDTMNQVLPGLATLLIQEADNTRKFRAQLQHLHYQSDYENLLARVEKGAAYYEKFCNGLLFQVMLHKAEVAQFAKTKTYLTALEDLDQSISRRVADLQRAKLLTKAILEGRKPDGLEDAENVRKATRESFRLKISSIVATHPDRKVSKTGRASKAKKEKVKGQTYEETFQLFDSGLDLEGIAKKRGLTASTIEGHLARGVAEGRIDVHKILPSHEYEDILAYFEKSEDTGLNPAYAHFKGKYSYGKLRMAQASLPPVA